MIIDIKGSLNIYYCHSLRQTVRNRFVVDSCPNRWTPDNIRNERDHLNQYGQFISIIILWIICTHIILIVIIELLPLYHPQKYIRGESAFCVCCWPCLLVALRIYRLVCTHRERVSLQSANPKQSQQQQRQLGHINYSSG
jgi:hypothetical protein